MMQIIVAFELCNVYNTVLYLRVFLYFLLIFITSTIYDE